MKTLRLSPLKLIRKSCVHCCGGYLKSVRFCCDTECALWYLRFGKFPRTYVRENGKKTEQLFNPKNFEIGGKFSPDMVESDYKL